jgi:hypothetical protein
MDKRCYEEYRDVLSVINKRTFDTFVRLYEEGPIVVDKFKRTKALDELIRGGFVQNSWEDGIRYYKVTVIGQRIFEKVADVVDGW